jgi:hypothetical protein
MSALALSVSSPVPAAKFVVNPSNHVFGATAKATAKPAAKLRLVKSEAQPTTVWKSYIEEDTQGLLRALQRMVAVHPLVRSALKGQTASQGTSLLFTAQDIAHDLFLVLRQKERFQHYVQSGMTDAEIEREIYQVELTNYLIATLRRCRPENYRLARRIGNILETDARFSMMSAAGNAHARQSGENVFGLVEWHEGKTAKDSDQIEIALAQISMRKRDLRRVGCSGDTQVIISNQELAVLLAEILTALDAPTPLRKLRQLALSKLPVWDVTLMPIETDAYEERSGRISLSALASTQANPEECALQNEETALAQRKAYSFLANLHDSTRKNAVRTERLWRVLWHCYFDPAEPTQMAIAEMLGISDSSIGDYRRKLEAEMRCLNLSFSQITHFSEALRQELRHRLFIISAVNEPLRRAEKTDKREFEAHVSGTAMLPVMLAPPTARRFDYAQAY